jgi:sensor histidine kinase regulating citrate/malate metabolism
MSLRARLLVLITGTVAAVVLALSALQLNSLVTTLLDHASERSAATAQLVKTQVVMRTAASRPQGESLGDVKLAWRRATWNSRTSSPRRWPKRARLSRSRWPRN